MMKHLKTVNHDYIRYANCWEDADLLLEALEVQPGDRVLSIGSAGDNSFSLLCGEPELVIAVDINKAQLALIELKKAGISKLDHKSFLELLGFTASKKRLDIFQLIKKELPQDAQDYWNDKKDLIEAGLIHQGKFEKYFRLFRTKVLPIIHNSSSIDNLFKDKTLTAQHDFYDTKWNNLRWKSLFNIFFSKLVMGRLGRDPQFLKEVNLPVGKFIYEQAATHLSSKHCQSNFFLDYILRGSFSTQLPHYAREENFYKIKSNIDKLIIRSGYAQDVATEYAGLNKFNLSNIFEYMNQQVFQTVAAKLVAVSGDKAKFAYWNLMAPRDLTLTSDALDKTNFQYSNDKGFFYSSFNLNIRL